MVKTLLALIWLETLGHSPGNGVGNISAAGFVNGAEVSHWPGLAWRPPWFADPAPDASPRTLELHQAMLEGQEPSAFRAYASRAEALTDWLALLAHKFPQMLSAAATGDVDALAVAYVSSGYTVPEASATAVAANLRGEISSLDKSGAFTGLAVAPPVPGPVESVVGAGFVLVILGTLGIWAARRAA